ncbi:EAL domain-containing protein [uncultured Castellaniella sp.]|uniref:bifunctional diguanylate cyclase/phosphodiesterase n=1 Tax=uncultured Castellaniella sp. TaxID=647907 RepID=UPI002621A62A|nr:EAL domain-containing protein [uncultured Castellaniella sp.]
MSGALRRLFSASRADSRPGVLGNLRLRLFMAVLATAIPIIGGLGYYIWHQYQGLMLSSERSAENLVQVTAAYDRTLLNDARDVLLSLSNSPVLRDARWHECRGYFTSLLAHLPRYLNLGVIGADGRQVCSGLPDPDRKGSFLGDRSYFHAAMEEPDVILGGFIIGRMSGVPTVVLAVRVPGDSGITAGVAYAGMNLGYLRAGAAIPELLPQARLWILDRQGYILQRVPGNSSHLGERLDPYPDQQTGLLRNAYTDADQVRWIVYSVPAGPRGDPQGLSVRYEIPEAALYAEARRALWTGLLIMGLLLCVALLAAGNLMQRALAHQASHDSLTRLLNRGAILHRLQMRTQQGLDKPWTLVISNIDGFKEVNGALGHDVGDRLLQAVALRFRDCLGGACSLARLGSDEFAFLLDTDDPAQADALVRDLLAATREPFTVNALQVRINCSFGLAVYPEHAHAPDELIRCADTAMRRAKREGLGSAVFDVRDRAQVQDRQLLRADLRAALAQGQFLLHLQPKIALGNDALAPGTPVGFEALARWQHPDRGLVSPAQFIPIIEVSDLIHPFTRWVVDQAVAACVRLQAVRPGVIMAVNISARNLLDEYFPQQVEDALAQHSLDPALLELEVTESVIMADPARSLRTLYALHALGVRLSIDDFGTGYSSFAYLNRLPVDALKIDQSFVAGMAGDSDLRAIVRSIIEMSHTLGLQVIAEGIETRAVQDMLRDLGCDVGQGYGIGRPMPEERAAAWLRDAIAT